MLSVAIIEDDDKDANELIKVIEQYETDKKYKFNIYRFTNAETFLNKYKPLYDIVFMDIELDETIDGMSAAKILRKYDNDVMLIFVTNMAQLAIKGYEVSAADYFVQPVNYYDVKMRLDRVVRMCQPNKFCISIHVLGGIKRMSPDEIYYVEVKDHTLIYHTKQVVYSMRGKLNDVEKLLENAGFARCSISYLVNINYCTEIRTDTVVV